MKIAYLINQYPKISHSFIRREILALEELGIQILRIALRAEEPVVDPLDRLEKEKTEYLLHGGGRTIFILVANALCVLGASPVRFFQALRQAIALSHRSDRSLPYHLAYLLEACRLHRILKAHEITHLHAHFGTNATEIALLANRLGDTPYSFTVHGPEEFDRPEALHLAEKISAAKFVVAVSSFGRSQLFRWVPYRQWEKIQVVHCGLENTLLQRPLSPVPNVPVLVCVGRLCEQKGQLILIEAAGILKAKNILFKLVLAGDGEMRPQIEAMVQRYHLESSVRITGWISNATVCEELLSSRAMVLPSFAEGLPVAIMEAMALNRPVITTAIAGIPELVLNEKCGWVCTAGSVEELANAMEACLTMPVDQLNQMATLGHSRVLERHSIETEAQKLAALFALSTAGPAQ